MKTVLFNISRSLIFFTNNINNFKKVKYTSVKEQVSSIEIISFLSCKNLLSVSVVFYRYGYLIFFFIYDTQTRYHIIYRYRYLTPFPTTSVQKFIFTASTLGKGTTIRFIFLCYCTTGGCNISCNFGR